MISEDDRRDHIHLLASIKASGHEVALEVEFHEALVDGSIVKRSDWSLPNTQHPEVLLAIRKVQELVLRHGRE